MATQSSLEPVNPEASAALRESSRNPATLLRRVEAETQKAFAEDPGFKAKSLTALNNEAVGWMRKGEYVRAISAYAKVFRRVREENVTHAELHVCYGNRSAAWYALGMYDKALKDAEKCRTLAEFGIQRHTSPKASQYSRFLCRGGGFSASYVKSFVRKGLALLAMGASREASAVFGEGAKLDPLNAEMRLGLEQATRQILSDLVEGPTAGRAVQVDLGVSGKGKETLCLPPAAACERITNLPYATPLHKIKVEEVLPSKLLTPQQAERDYHIRDTYNFVTIQADTEMPLRALGTLSDRKRCAAFSGAVQKAVERIQARAVDPRVLCLGSGSALLPMAALRAGAKHVTVAERWLYLALSCKETLELNGFREDSYKVVYKRPTDLTVEHDVPVCCNICVNELLDEGLLTSGMIPSFRHCLDSLLIHDPVLVPARATVFIQAIELRTDQIMGYDLSAVDEYRWLPFFTCGLPLDCESYQSLSEAQEAWHFDFYCSPDCSARKIVDVRFTTDGIFNAVLFWYELDLGEDVRFSTAPDCRRDSSSLHPCVQYLPGQLQVETGMTFPLVCSHNTVRLRFDIEEAEYLHLTKTNGCFSPSVFSLLRDTPLLEAYSAAIDAAVRRLRERDGKVAALDVGCGSGILSVMCVKHGCSSVVACDVQEAMVDITLKTLARNGSACKAAVLCDDGAHLKRGGAVPFDGFNLVVNQVYDSGAPTVAQPRRNAFLCWWSGLLGHNILSLAEALRRNVLRHDAVAIPFKAAIYCMGIQVQAPVLEGYDFSAFDKYRWDAHSTPTPLRRLEHRRLTRPAKVFEFELNGRQTGRGREKIVRLVAAADGCLNAVAAWFDLWLDEENVVTTAPDGIGIGGKIETGDDASPAAANSRHLGQTVHYLDEKVAITKGQRLVLIARREGEALRFHLRQGIGQAVDRAPWKVQWGGGASVENPHFQRVHYCQLLVNDFKMRCKASRFPSIREDLEIMYRHCGSLLLDPYSLTKTGRELVTIEKLCQRNAPTPAATPASIEGTHFFYD